MHEESVAISKLMAKLTFCHDLALLNHQVKDWDDDERAIFDNEVHLG